MPGRAFMALIEPIRMMRPLACASIACAAALLSTHTAVRLVCITRLKSSSSKSTSARRWLMPALATRMSKRPHFSFKPATHACAAAASVTSNGALSADQPWAWSSLTRARRAPESRAFNTTCAPAWAKDWAMAQPRPFEAPVMRAIFPFRLNISRVSLHWVDWYGVQARYSRAAAEIARPASAPKIP